MRKWIIILAGIIIAVVIGYTYIYQDHRSIEAEKAEFTISSEEIAQLFSENSVSAEHKFLNKTIVVSGIISEINAKDITISDQVFCQFSNAIKIELSQQIQINIKGRVIGYDDLLQQVKLDQCTIIKL